MTTSRQDQMKDGTDFSQSVCGLPRDRTCGGSIMILEAIPCTLKRTYRTTPPIIRTQTEAGNRATATSTNPGIVPRLTRCSRLLDERSTTKWTYPTNSTEIRRQFFF
uniref:(northern house mosquito) hypothetical protein n=1 Tax=Culex pipiens TaxID=7175 RepID=A0A8D8DY33_CULPI